MKQNSVYGYEKAGVKITSVNDKNEKNIGKGVEKLNIL